MRQTPKTHRLGAAITAVLAGVPVKGTAVKASPLPRRRITDSKRPNSQRTTDGIPSWWLEKNLGTD